jgi:hypothetical protein
VVIVLHPSGEFIADGLEWIASGFESGFKRVEFPLIFHSFADFATLNSHSSFITVDFHSLQLLLVLQPLLLLITKLNLHRLMK